jgi:hypothetical protein
LHLLVNLCMALDHAYGGEQMELGGGEGEGEGEARGHGAWALDSALTELQASEVPAHSVGLGGRARPGWRPKV